MSSTYLQHKNLRRKLLNLTSNAAKKCDLKITEQDKTLPIMYWLTKIHKTLIDARFIVASKNYSTRLCLMWLLRFSKWSLTILKVFIEKTCFTHALKSFWVAQNSFSVVPKLNKINIKKKAKSISTFDFTILYTIIPHNLVNKVLFVTFIFKSKARSCVFKCI